MRALTHDLYLSLRSLLKSPGYTLTAVATLALGILGNTVVFSIMNATFLRPLPYPEPRRLVIVRWKDQGDVSARAFFMIKNGARSLAVVAALYPAEAGVNISGTGPPHYVRALSVSKDFFHALGVAPEIGNVFTEDDDQPNASPTAVLSHALWLQSFSQDPAVLGREIRINGESYRIIGVMPQFFQSFPDADIWLPLQLNPASADPGNNYRVIGRLRDGISRQQSQYELEGLAREYRLTYLPSVPKGTLVLDDLQSFLVHREREGLVILLAAVGLVFLIACANVAVLILVRAAGNTHATAIRVALGPSRGRLVLSLLTESLLLAVSGGVLGLILAKESIPLLLALWPAGLPFIHGLAIDRHVVLFTLGVSILSPLVFGLVPALNLSRVNIARVLAQTSRTATHSAEHARMVRMLLFGQVALTNMLLAGTMLLSKSLLNLSSVPLGFQSEHLFVAQVSLAGERYAKTSSVNHVVGDLLKQLQTSPGVEAAAAVNGLPLDNGINLPLRPLDIPHTVDHADEYRPVTPDYFSTLGIALRTGRFFTANDIAGNQPVAIINETMARHWWPNGNAVGHYVKVDTELGPQAADAPRQIVGVVSDIQEKGQGAPPPPTMFVPLSQTPDNINAFFNKVFLTSIVLRTSNSVDLSKNVSHSIQSVDPDLPLATFGPFRQFTDRSLADPRFVVLITAGFCAFAVLLTTIGIHGVLNYQARLRTREIAVRMAIGARRADIVRMIVQQGGKLIAYGVLAGVGGSFIVKTLLGSLLYNIRGSSLILILTTGLLLASIAAPISLLTAVRAASIEPMVVLRNE